MECRLRHLLSVTVVALTFVSVAAQSSVSTSLETTKPTPSVTPSNAPITASPSPTAAESPTPGPSPTVPPKTAEEYVGSLSVGEWFSITKFPVWYIWIFVVIAFLVGGGLFYLRLKRPARSGPGFFKWIGWLGVALLLLLFMIIGFWIGGWRANSELTSLVAQGRLRTWDTPIRPIEPTATPAPITTDSAGSSSTQLGSLFFWALLILSFLLLAGLETILYFFFRERSYWLRNRYGEYRPLRDDYSYQFEGTLWERFDYLAQQISSLKRSISSMKRLLDEREP